MVQDLKDSGRVPVVISASGVVSVTAVGLITFNMYRGGAVTSVSNYTVPANKTFRMQAVQFGVRFTTMSTTVTFGNTTFAIRYSPSGSGAVVVTSPILIQDSKAAASNVPTPNSDLSIPDGLELPAGHTLGVTHLASAATLSEDILIVGYEF